LHDGQPLGTWFPSLVPLHVQSDQSTILHFCLVQVVFTVNCILCFDKNVLRSTVLFKVIKHFFRISRNSCKGPKGSRKST
jgi:hypothetical protein